MSKEIDILIKRCQKQDRKAQSIVYQQFANVMFGVCMKYSNSYEEAQDTFQDAFIKAFDKIKQFNFNGSFEGWLKRIMVNECIERHRKKKTVRLHPQFQNFMEDTIEDEPVDSKKPQLSMNELIDMIQELPEKYRMVFNLYYMEKLTHKQISEALEISEGTSKSNLSRAKVWLQNYMEKNDILKKKVIND